MTMGVHARRSERGPAGNLATGGQKLVVLDRVIR